jgi:hypothetical protein
MLYDPIGKDGDHGMSGKENRLRYINGEGDLCLAVFKNGVLVKTEIVKKFFQNGKMTNYPYPRGDFYIVKKEEART